jgi:hypothetical protein
MWPALAPMLAWGGKDFFLDCNCTEKTHAEPVLTRAKKNPADVAHSCAKSNEATEGFF